MQLSKAGASDLDGADEMDDGDGRGSWWNGSGAWW